jgi:hypothetical protein
MAEKNDTKVPTIEVPRNANGVGVDVKQTVLNAEKVATAFAAQDAEASKAVAATTQKILSDAKHKDVTSFTASVIAKMALGLMGEIPTDKLCTETEERVKAFLKGQPDKYLHIERGRNSGFHIINRYSKEDLAKLQKSAKTSEA